MNGRFSTTEMESVLSVSALVCSMVDFEAALSRVQSSIGIIPEEIGVAITAACQNVKIPAEKLEILAPNSGTLAAPFLAELIAQVSEQNADAASYLHFGTTSQDLIDTASVLSLREAGKLLEAEMKALATALSELAKEHSNTVMLGRTMLQPSPQVTFGLKVAHWYGAISRAITRLQEANKHALTLQFGGVVGTLSAFGKAGIEIAEALGSELGLTVPPAPWHTQRDNLVELASAVGILAGSLGKIAIDIVLMMQFEVQEVSEPMLAGRGGSSAVPHKQNPVGCLVALSASRKVPGLVSTMMNSMVQEHERAVGAWQAEWPTLVDIYSNTAASLTAMKDVIEGLNVYPDQMLDNIKNTQGLTYSEAVSVALTLKVGRSDARRLTEVASRLAIESDTSFEQIILNSYDILNVINRDELTELFKQKGNLGVSQEFISRILNNRY